MKYNRAPEVDVKTFAVLCDICKMSVYRGGHQHSEVEVEASLGEIYDEGDARVLTTVDICPDCFMTKVKPAIEAMGATFRVCRREDQCEDKNLYQEVKPLGWCPGFDCYGYARPETPCCHCKRPKSAHPAVEEEKP